MLIIHSQVNIMIVYCHKISEERMPYAEALRVGRVLTELRGFFGLTPTYEEEFDGSIPGFRGTVSYTKATERNNPVLEILFDDDERKGITIIYHGRRISEERIQNALTEN
ncbi:MAG: hypothetical protein ABIA21_03995 [Candidatus Aenigmatarchaeota archaeon]